MCGSMLIFMAALAAAASTAAGLVVGKPGAGEPTLVDHPIAGPGAIGPLWLDGSWEATNSHQQARLNATVPGDIITDLQNAGRVCDPYWNVWNDGVWTYSKQFATPASLLATRVSAPTSVASEVLLVFDGIRMGASIALNGHFLGNATDQFLRYRFAVAALLSRGGGQAANVVTVTFHKDIATGGRFDYSTQIDWAPVFATKDPTATGPDAQHIEGRETFGMAIWKSVYLLAVPAGGAAITRFVPHTFYAGGHPTRILGDADHAGFEVRSRVTLWSPADGTTGKVTVALPGVAAAAATAGVTLAAGLNVVNVTIPASATRGVRLWHPRGNGDQARYNITAAFLPTAGTGESSSSTWRLLGFRHVALVTVNDTDPAVVAAAGAKNGNGQFGMLVRVNGAATYARGGNKIPMDLLNGRMSAYVEMPVVYYMYARH